MDRLYQDYIHNSSFPYALELRRPKDIRQYLEGIYDSIVLKDIIARRRIHDLEMLKSVTRFLFDNIGNLCSTKKIADTMTSAGRKIAVHTVENYLDALTESFIFYRAGRYDIKGKQYLKTGDKYYAADIGLRYCVLAAKRPMTAISWKTSSIWNSCAADMRCISARSELRRWTLSPLEKKAKNTTRLPIRSSTRMEKRWNANWLRWMPSKTTIQNIS